MFKNHIQKKLEKYVQKYFLAHPEVKLVIVAGSVGKTSTKMAIGTILSNRFRVRLHEGNHNTFLSAPLAILGIQYPDKVRSIRQWLRVFKAARQRIKQPADIDIIVQELGSDRVGQVDHFGIYLKPDYAVITAISAEHMEFFKTIDAVAREELSAANYSKFALINRDDISGQYAQYLSNSNINTYGTNANAEYHFVNQEYNLEDGYRGLLVAPDWNRHYSVNVHLFGEHTIRPVIAAVAIGIKFGMMPDEIIHGVEQIRAVPGRMNVLKGIKDSIIIDDTYNSSPLAAESSLRELYKVNAPQHIAVLGSMNELGLTSPDEHRELGKMCDPNQLAWVVVVGDEASKYLAPAAKARGCQVKICQTAIEAGGFVNSVIDDGAAVLFKGSQGDIYLEEAVKIVLHDASDEDKLVRQSPSWMKIKDKFFSKFK